MPAPTLLGRAFSAPPAGPEPVRVPHEQQDRPTLWYDTIVEWMVRIKVDMELYFQHFDYIEKKVAEDQYKWLETKSTVIAAEHRINQLEAKCAKWAETEMDIQQVPDGNIVEKEAIVASFVISSGSGTPRSSLFPGWRIRRLRSQSLDSQARQSSSRWTAGPGPQEWPIGPPLRLGRRRRRRPWGSSLHFQL